MKKKYILPFWKTFLRTIHLLQKRTESNAKYSNAYEFAGEWLSLPEGYVLGEPTGVSVDSNQNIVIFHRAGRKWSTSASDPYIQQDTIIVIDPHSGQIVRSWGANMFVMPHGLTIDKENNYWVTDVALHQIFKFNDSGELLMKLGRARTPGVDTNSFHSPTAVAMSPDGSFYVCDGYGNSRVMKFSAAGQYLFSWGKKGNKPGEFCLPHCIDVDSKGLVYVADRENNRIQIFDPNGTFLKQITSKKLGKIFSLVIDKSNDGLIFTHHVSKKSNIIFFDPIGSPTLKHSSNSPVNSPCLYHDIVMDDQGNIYVGDIIANTILKFRKTVEVA